MLNIGLTSCMFHPDPERAIFKGKRLLYMEESMFHWVLRHGAVAGLIPTVAATGLLLKDVVAHFDGILLSGGVDVAPEHYGEEPLQPEWSGDAFRDQYEIEIIKIALDHSIPILGICRGAQILNVALGGTLYQDITTQIPGTFEHRSWDKYDENCHQVRILKETGLSKIYPKISEFKINSIHHQGVKDLGKGLVAEAVSSSDDVIEAFRLKGDKFAVGIQWHPEFHRVEDDSILPSAPIMEEFLQAVAQRKR